ncbi:MAG: diacylglycerol kinase family protein [Cytobacillus gottheilii]|uniref:diacylglycerol/lipid kinase family protein n=1 Tax=Cytobacillus gottheilii TaxID=859144 RepID=UPI0008342270|nr:diacylglycerol kinase family protein [Cytobacillus gottheilii]
MNEQTDQLICIVNPSAQNGGCLKIWRKLEEQLKAEDVSYIAYFTKEKNHAAELTKKIAEQKRGKPVLIAVVGGDGTMHEVMNGAVKYKNVKIAFIPGGSGNDFSKGFHVSSDAMTALKELLPIRNQKGTYVDIGVIYEKNNKEPNYFINNMGAGFDAEVAFEANHSPFKQLLNVFSLGKLAYVLILLKRLFTYQRTELDITIDGKRYQYTNVWFVAISNQPYYGGGMKIAPKASPLDGKLDITVVHHVSRLKLLFVFLTVFSGNHVHIKGVEIFKGKSIQLDSRSQLSVHADGEAAGNTPISVALLPRQVQVLNGINQKEKEEVRQC